MKPQILANSLIFGLTLISLCPVLSRAGSETGTRGGGDIEFVRAPEIKRYIESPDQLKADLRGYFAALNLGRVDDPEVKTQLNAIVAGGLDADIQLSTYVVKPMCRDEQGVEHSASTTRGQKASEICFNLKNLAERGIKKSELVGLAAHEHARHFGYEDVSDYDHPIGSYVSQSFAKWIERETTLAPVPLKEKVIAQIDHNSSAPLRLQIAVTKGVRTYGNVFLFDENGDNLGNVGIRHMINLSGEFVDIPYQKGSHYVDTIAYDFDTNNSAPGQITVRLLQGETETARWTFDVKGTWIYNGMMLLR